MTSTPTTQADPAPIIACTISRDVQNFDLLIEDMETILGEAWGDLGFDEALAFMSQPEASSLEFVAMAIDAIDEGEVSQLAGIIKGARTHGIKVILIAEDVTPASLHQLLRSGANAAANNDVYPGTSLANGQLKFEFALTTNDVLTVMSRA